MLRTKMPRSLALGLLGLVLATGCATASSTTEEEGGEGATAAGDGVSADELVAERQLVGRELPERTVSLTFDDGPGKRTAELADFLAEQGIPAAFFINGNRVPGRQEAVDRVVGRGHLLANHTQTHRSLPSLAAEEVVKEIADTDALIHAVQPNGPWVIRAPFGAWNGTVANAVNASAMRKYVGSVFWDEGGQLTDTAAADWACWGQDISVERCGELYLNEIRTKKRGIVLLHDIHDRTVEMVKTVIVPALVAEGYAFTPLVEVPSVKRALEAPPPAPRQCESATLGRPVDENVCVQSRSNERWFRCVDGEWHGIDGPEDPRCTERFPLAPAP